MFSHVTFWNWSSALHLYRDREVGHRTKWLKASNAILSNNSYFIPSTKGLNFFFQRPVLSEIVFFWVDFYILKKPLTKPQREEAMSNFSFNFYLIGGHTWKTYHLSSNTVYSVKPFRKQGVLKNNKREGTQSPIIFAVINFFVCFYTSKYQQLKNSG